MNTLLLIVWVLGIVLFGGLVYRLFRKSPAVDFLEVVGATLIVVFWPTFISMAFVVFLLMLLDMGIRGRA